MRFKRNEVEVFGPPPHVLFDLLSQKSCRGGAGGEWEGRELWGRAVVEGGAPLSIANDM